MGHTYNPGTINLNAKYMQQDPYKELALNWVANLLNQMPFIRKLNSNHEWHSLIDSLSETSLMTDHEFDSEISPEELKERIQSWLKAKRSVSIDETVLGMNINLLGDEIQLTDSDKIIFGFLVICRQQPILSIVTSTIGQLTKHDMIKLISEFTETNIQDVKRSLSPSGVLIKTGLVKIKPHNDRINEKIEFQNGIDEILSDELMASDSLREIFIQKVNDPELTVANYYYLKDELEYIIPYLKNACSKNAKGCNILLYGPPGTGKTELCKVIAKEVGAKLSEVETEKSECHWVNRTDRVLSYILGSMMLQNKNDQLIMFDELEDIFCFDPKNNSYRDNFTLSKSWFNRLLENNHIPTLWTTNKINNIDPSFLRRFDIIVEVGIPPKSYTKKLVCERLETRSQENQWVESVTDCLELTSSEIVRLAKVINISNGFENKIETATRLLENSYKAYNNGIKYNIRKFHHNACSGYNLNWLNSDADIEAIIRGISTQKRGRLCLYGPSGTGKTQLAYEISKSTGLSIISKSASDLTSCYVGETEKNIARVFQEAKSNNSILLIDEIDTFLIDRNKHQRIWETSQVNELLIQMEQFDGVLIGSTNLVDTLDHASLRRFDFKIRFEYPTLNQIIDMYKTFTGEDDMCHVNRLKEIRPLTPGNFVVAKRQAEILGLKLTGDFLINVLQAESRFNIMDQTSKPIGFIH